MQISINTWSYIKDVKRLKREEKYIGTNEAINISATKKEKHVKSRFSEKHHRSTGI